MKFKRQKFSKKLVKQGGGIAIEGFAGQFYPGSTKKEWMQIIDARIMACLTDAEFLNALRSEFTVTKGEVNYEAKRTKTKRS